MSNTEKIAEPSIELEARMAEAEDAEWEGPALPDPYVLTVPEESANRCVVGAECVAEQNGEGALIGWHLDVIQDTYDSGAEALRWFTGFLVDGRWVMCEDCTGFYECAELTHEDGKWVWIDPKVEGPSIRWTGPIPVDLTKGCDCDQ